MMNPVEELKTLREECILQEENIDVYENKSYELKTNERMMELTLHLIYLNLMQIKLELR